MKRRSHRIPWEGGNRPHLMDCSVRKGDGTLSKFRSLRGSAPHLRLSRLCGVAWRGVAFEPNNHTNKIYMEIENKIPNY